ncbi:GntR family transcriptional regulator, partial [Alcaligenes pakistanensis]
MFGVSRITVRQGLAILTRNGLIERFPSRGSFVLERKNTGSWELGSINDLVQLGKDTSTKIA